MVRRLRLPDFLVVGSMKCGTTSLHHYLACHPEVGVAWPKELNYFIGGEHRDGSDPPWGNWWRGERWYQSHFDTDKRVCGEVSPAYVGDGWGAVVARRMCRAVPDVRLVLLVRDPMERLRSHFLMLRRDLEIPPVSFSEFVLADRHSDVVAYSHYGSQVARLREFFPAESILVVESAALDADRPRTLAMIFEFLGVDAGFRSPAFDRRLFVGRRRRFPSAIGAALLRSFPYRGAEKILPFTIREGLRNIVLWPFTASEPSLDLPAPVERRLRDRFRAEVDLLRRLTGLGLPTLGS